MGNSRRLKRRMRQEAALKAKPSTQERKLVVGIASPDGQVKTVEMTRGELAYTLAEMERKGWTVSYDDTGIDLASPLPTPTPEPPTPTPEPETTMDRTVNATRKDAHLSKQGQQEYLALCQKLREIGLEWYQISIEVCQYQSSDSAKRACGMIERGRSAGSLRALKLLREKVPEMEAEREPEKATTIAAPAPAPATIPAPAPTPSPAPSVGWWVDYQAALSVAEASAAHFRSAMSKMEEDLLSLEIAVENVPDDFRGPAMEKRFSELRRLVNYLL